MKISLRSLFARSRVVALGATMLAVAACSILPPKETPNVYVLPQNATPVSPDDNAQPFAWQLRVDTPEVTGLLDNSGIVVLPEPGRITVYADSRWSDAPPVLFRERLIDAFLATHRLPAVTSEDDSLRADFVLGGDLRAFQSEYHDGSPVVVVRYDAQLRRGGARDVLVARSFEVSVNPSGTSVPLVVQAFGAAGDQLSAQVVAWTLAQAQQQWQAQQAAAAAATPSPQPDEGQSVQRHARRRH